VRGKASRNPGGSAGAVAAGGPRRQSLIWQPRDRDQLPAQPSSRTRRATAGRPTVRFVTSFAMNNVVQASRPDAAGCRPVAAIDGRDAAAASARRHGEGPDIITSYDQPMVSSSGPRAPGRASAKAQPGMLDVRNILSQHFLLKQLPPHDLERLAQLATTRKFDPGEAVFLKGDPGNAMMAVLSGRVRICAYSAGGREVVLNVISPGEVFGEIAMIDGGERTADAFAMENTDLLVLNRRDFMPFLERNPHVCVKLLEILCRRLRWTSEQLEDVNFLDLRSRLAKRILHLVDSQGEPVSNSRNVGVRISQHMLASMIGTSREAVNKQLRFWEEEGLIDVKRGSITVLKRDHLKRIVAEGAP
jgi:CRP-like cAMP-binding protein